jgi:receptor protein-tyrosine kinase
MDKLEEAQVAEELERSRVANVFVANWPRMPSAPVAPDKKARIFLAIPAGLIAGIGAAFAAFFLDHTVKRPEDLEKCTGVPVFSSIGVVRR